MSVTQRYGDALALDDVSFDVHQGEIHALVGENGAGKSTLIRILTGALHPTSGGLEMDQQALAFSSPRDAQAAGIGVVHQDYHLFPSLTVAQNICGVVPVESARKRLLTDRAAMLKTAVPLMADLGLDVDPHRSAGGLDAAERKLIEIARALVLRPRFLLLDEPTAALEPAETERLLEVISRLRDRGTGIILVTHRLGEICRVADRASALRDGRFVGTVAKSDLSPASLTALMVGTEVVELEGPQHPAGDVTFTLDGLTLRRDTTPIKLEVREREIVAVVGLVGSGCPAVLGALTGATYRKEVQLQLDGSPVRIRTPRDATRLGVGSAPEDRKRFGLVAQQSIADNMALGSLSRWSRFGFTSRRRLSHHAALLRERFDIRCESLDQPVGSLSGGNQQKVLLARGELAGATMFVLHEPSQGVDVLARRSIHEYLLSFAATGGKVVFSSTDVDEVRAIAHRIYVLHAGETAIVFDNTGPSRPTRSQLTQAISADPRLSTPSSNEVPA